MKKYWLEDNLGEYHIFEAEDKEAAHHYFMMSGDHAYDYGLADKQFFLNRLKGVDPKTKN